MAIRPTLRLLALGVALALTVERGGLGGGWLRLPGPSEHQCGCLRCPDEATCCCALEEPQGPWRILACDASSEEKALSGGTPATLPHVPQTPSLPTLGGLPSQASQGFPARNLEPLEPPPRLLL